MATVEEGKKRAGADTVDPPRSLREALEGVPQSKRNSYLSLREAFLSLERTGESFRPGGPCWQPVLLVGRSEVATVDFAIQPRRGMTVQIKPLHEDWLAGLSTASELRPATRRRFRDGKPGRATPLPVNTESDLADVVVVLLLLHARLVGGGRL